MYPTKPFDDGPHRQEHALRHVRVQNAAYASGEHAGCFGWCMFDYQTHKDFGSGDRICYHGVLDTSPLLGYDWGAYWLRYGWDLCPIDPHDSFSDDQLSSSGRDRGSGGGKLS